VKNFFKLVCFLIILSFFQCNSEKKKKEKFVKKEKFKDPKEQQEKLIVKPWDSLNRFNTEDFLLAYGKKNPETNVIIKTKFGNIKLLLYKDVQIGRASCRERVY
jgi:peptidylprolyl isomerase